MKFTMRCVAAGLVAATGMLSGCLTMPRPQMEGVVPVQPGPNETVVLNDLYIVVDASGSMHTPDKFRVAKDLVKSFALVAPEDYYGVQLNTFGSEWKIDWLNMSMETFDRVRLVENANKISFISGSTPLAEALDMLAPTMRGSRTHSAVLIFSDGMSDAGATMASARNLLNQHPGRLCFHTVHLGCEAEGAALMQQLSLLTDCGTTRDAASASHVPGLEMLARDVFFGPYLDSDNDGVPDPRDLCPDSPAGMTVNGYGCHSWGTVYFDTDKSVVKRNQKDVLDYVASRMLNASDLCLRVEGHADSRNEVDYNQRLSERRVDAVRDELIKRGVGAERLITTGFSELRPVAPNTSAHNMQLNRRVELIPLP